MAKLRAFRVFDMRGVIPDDAVDAGTDAAIVDGSTRTVFLGPFQGSAAGGYAGTLNGFLQTQAGRTVFEATGIERSAARSLAIVADRDNDGFLAYTLSDDDTIFGSTGDDYLIGFGGDDTISGGAGDDQLFGGSGRDLVRGGEGDDFLAGGNDTDTLAGGDGDDTYLVNQRGDRVSEQGGAGRDSVLSTVSIRIPAHVERLVLIGDGRIDGYGTSGSDDIDGNEVGNRLFGRSGRDLLDGDGGADLLDGGGGADLLRGGRGADTFRFATAREADGDRVADFGNGADRIDLSAIDASASRRGDQGFDWIGSRSFSGHEGELRISGGRLLGDIDGDRRADFAVLLLDHDGGLDRGDLIL